MKREQVSEEAQLGHALSAFLVACYHHDYSKIINTRNYVVAKVRVKFVYDVRSKFLVAESTRITVKLFFIWSSKGSHT